MPVTCTLQRALDKRKITAKSLVGYLPDISRESTLTDIKQGNVAATKDTLRMLCDVLNTKPTDIYPNMKQLDYSDLVAPKRPNITHTDSRDRSGRIWMDAGNEESKDRILEQAHRHGYDGWQRLLDLLVTVLNLMDAGAFQMKQPGGGMKADYTPRPGGNGGRT